MSRKHTTMIALALALAGCVPKAPVRELALAVPQSYGIDAAPEAEQVGAWRGVFTDSQLTLLIEEALAHNQELEILGQRIQMSHADVVAKRGAYLPRLRLDAGGGVEKVGLYTSQGASDEIHDIEEGEAFPEPLGDVHLALRTEWEVDLWGELKKRKRAAQFRYLSSVEGQNFAVTQLVAEVADTYYEVLALDRELETVDAYIALLEDSLKVVRLQKEAAREDELAVQRFEAELLKFQSRRFELKQEVVEVENELNFLCGRLPQPVDRSSERFDAPVKVAFDPGDPATLLERRPDVRAAELQLEAAKLDVKAARAAFYPSLTVDAGIGGEAYKLARLGTMPESLLYDLAGGLAAPLLNRADLKGEYLAANAEQSAAVVEYERTVLEAYIEVVNQLTRIGNLGESFALREQQVARLDDAIQTSNDLFQSARANYLEVLTTRRDALESQMELIETRRALLGARVDLYRALGGGWDMPAGGDQ